MTAFDRLPAPVIRLQETDSTSNYMTTLSIEQELKEFTVVRADFQTAGKGQRGNSWESEVGKNLLFSIILYPEFLEVRKQFILSQVVSLAIKEELDTLSDGFSIKWPNDIYWHDQKICGILIENDLFGSTIKRSIAGIGINVNQEGFQSPAPNPVSLWQITGKVYDMDILLNGVIRRIIQNYEFLKEKKYEEISLRYHHSLYRKEGVYPFRDKSGEFMAQIMCVKPEGTLILKDNNGNERGYLFKEVQYIP